MDQSNNSNTAKGIQKWYIYTICFIWLRSYFSAIWKRLGLGELDIPNIIIIVFLLFISRRVWKGRILVSDMLFYFFLVFCYIFSAFVYPATSDNVYGNAFMVICCTLPYIFIGEIFQIVDYEKWITYASRFVIIINVLYSFTRISSSSEVDVESMHRAYALLPSVLFLLWQSIDKRKVLDLVFVSVGLVMVMSMGSRGPIVCILFFVGCYLLFFKKYKHPIIIKSLIIGILSLLYIGAQYIAEFMIVFFSRLSMSTRIFDKMLNDAFINYEASSGRNEIHSLLLNKLNEDASGFGFGLFSDRVASSTFFREDWYAHNFFVEIWFSFGYYLGSFIIILLFVLIAYYFLKIKNKEKKVLALLLLSVSVVKLQFSGSFILDQSLFFLIGYCIYGIRESKKLVKCD